MEEDRITLFGPLAPEEKNLLCFSMKGCGRLAAAFIVFGLLLWLFGKWDTNELLTAIVITLLFSVLGPLLFLFQLRFLCVVIQWLRALQGK